MTRGGYRRPPFRTEGACCKTDNTHTPGRGARRRAVGRRIFGEAERTERAPERASCARNAQRLRVTAAGRALRRAIPRLDRRQRAGAPREDLVSGDAAPSRGGGAGPLGLGPVLSG